MLYVLRLYITKTHLFKYIEYFTSKNWSILDKNSDIFNISAQNMFLSRNKKNNVYPCKPQFYYVKEGFEGGQNYIGVFSWWN